jgi:hypothetical protein
VTAPMRAADVVLRGRSTAMGAASTFKQTTAIVAAAQGGVAMTVQAVPA